VGATGLLKRDEQYSLLEPLPNFKSYRHIPRLRHQVSLALSPLQDGTLCTESVASPAYIASVKSIPINPSIAQSPQRFFGDARARLCVSSHNLKRLLCHPVLSDLTGGLPVELSLVMRAYTHLMITKGRQFVEALMTPVSKDMMIHDGRLTFQHTTVIVAGENSMSLYMAIVWLKGRTLTSPPR